MLDDDTNYGPCVAEIPQERILPPTDAPLFFGAAMEDWVCVATMGFETMRNAAFKDHDVTIREFQADHWLLFSVPDEVCRALEDWVERSVLKE